MIISPIFYMGNKKKLINKGLINLFPKNINRFFDIFGGSGIISLNVEANEIYLNDKDTNLYNLYKMFKEYDVDTIINHIKGNIEKYGLALEGTRRCSYTDKHKLEEYKNAYLNLRDEYNRNRSILDFYTLMFYAFSQQFRFNSKGEFNMPVGNNFFTDNNEEYIRLAYDKLNSMRIGNYDFRHFANNISHITKNDFIYLDPPYFNTTATYNEKGGWTEDDENDLLQFCDELNKRGIKFGMSNVFECKGKVNQHLIDWCENNGYRVYTFDKFSYMACGKGNSNAKEVFICNY